MTWKNTAPLPRKGPTYLPVKLGWDVELPQRNDCFPPAHLRNGRALPTRPYHTSSIALFGVGEAAITSSLASRKDGFCAVSREQERLFCSLLAPSPLLKPQAG